MGDFTYQEVGATRPGEPLPTGYRHLDRRMRVGTGQAAFEAAGEAVVTFRMHAGMHLRPQASAKRAEPGTFVVVHVALARFVLVRAECEVVWVIDEPRRRGFGYGTLRRHPERGEEGFAVDRDEDDAVWLTVRVFSVGARWYTRAAGPLVPLFQRGYALYCAAVLRRIVRGGTA